MKCPNCGLENPENALQCDCGYHFDQRKIVDNFRSIKKDRKNIFFGDWFFLYCVSYVGCLMIGLFLLKQGFFEFEDTFDSWHSLGNKWLSMAFLIFANSFVAATITAYLRYFIDKKAGFIKDEIQAKKKYIKIAIFYHGLLTAIGFFVLAVPFSLIFILFSGG